MPKAICKNCGKKFKVYRGAKYCSMECFWTDTRKKHLAYKEKIMKGEI